MRGRSVGGLGLLYSCDQTKKHPIITVEGTQYHRYKYLLQSHPDDDDGSVSEGELRIVDFHGESMAGLTTHELITNMFACINGITCIGGIFKGDRGLYGFVLWNPVIRERKTVAYPNVLIVLSILFH